MPENLNQFSQGLDLIFTVAIVTFIIPPASSSSGISFHFLLIDLGHLLFLNQLLARGMELPLGLIL